MLYILLHLKTTKYLLALKLPSLISGNDHKKSIIMNKVLSGALIFVITFLGACADKEPEKDLTIQPADTGKVVSSAIADTGNKIQTLPANTLNATQAVMPAQTTTTATTAQPVTTAPGMNPPHGQPNHRCDIAVGAPLNSPAAKPAATTTTQTITPSATKAQPMVVQTPAQPAVKTAPGMNPPHGEPNHRCDIAVGAPLNSPVAKPAATPAVKAVAAPAIESLKAESLPAKKDSN